jgi:hypothetical protein
MTNIKSIIIEIFVNDLFNCLLISNSKALCVINKKTFGNGKATECGRSPTLGIFTFFILLIEGY